MVSDLVPVVAGRGYFIRATLRHNTTNPLRTGFLDIFYVRMSWYTSAEAWISDGAGTLISGNFSVDTWHDNQSALDVAPSNATFGKAQIVLARSAGGVLADAYVDSVVITEDMPQYALLNGRASGQTLIGGTASGENLTLQSTAHATKGSVFFGAAHASYYDEANERMVLAEASNPTLRLSEGDSATSYLEIVDAQSTQGLIQKTAASGGAILDIDLIASDGTGAATLRLFRSTNTSGAKSLALYQGDGTATIDGVISTNGGASYVSGSLKSTSPTGGIGYASGAGGAVTQATSKATGVTLNKVCGDITMDGASLAAATIVSFTLTDSAIAATDTLVLNHVTTGTRGGYSLNAQCGAGSAVIYVRNNTTGSLSEAIVIRFALIKGVTT
jgi:hypothetical protein